MQNLRTLINYWCLRYLLVTELYMVERWERVMIHIVFFIILSIISLFNTTVVLGLVSYITNSILNNEMPSGTAFQATEPLVHSEF